MEAPFSATQEKRRGEKNPLQTLSASLPHHKLTQVSSLLFREEKKKLKACLSF